MPSYEFIEHTAEIGVKATGRTREELFSHMAQGMFALIVPPDQVQPKSSVSVTAKAEGWDRLLVAWLKELLYLFDTRHFLGIDFKIKRMDATSIEAVATGETLDLNRHSVDKEVKAVTYCDLLLTQQPDGSWMAQVIFDI
jgi:SHS2 domain-containing protein